MSPNAEDGNQSVACRYCRDTFKSHRAAAIHHGHSPGGRCPSDDELLSELRDYAAVIGKTPTARGMKAEGPFSFDIYERRFGTWNEALTAAGLTVKHRRGIPDDELLDALRTLVDDLGRPPTQDEITELTEFTDQRYYQRFGSLTNALLEIGVEPSKRLNIPTETLSDELHRVNGLVDGPVCWYHMDNLGRFSHNTYQARWGTWRNAVRENGLTPSEEGVSQPESDQTPAAFRRYYGPDWPEQRRARLEHDGYQCISCSVDDEAYREKTGHGLDVHHVIRFGSFAPFESDEDYAEANRLENLRTFCRPCHRKWENLPIAPIE